MQPITFMKKRLKLIIMRTIQSWILLFLLLTACNENVILLDEINDDQINYSDSLISISGLSLYWKHFVFGDEGRRIIFEFYDIKEKNYDYELVFHYTIDKNTINVYLIDTLNHGKCAAFPSPYGLDTMCISKGGFYISDTILINDHYKFELITKDFVVHCDFNITDSSYQLIIPDNNNFTCSIENVFPIPKDIVYGSIVFNGNNNMDDANKLKEEYKKLGLQNTTLPDYPNRHFFLNEDGTPIDKTWPPDKYSLGLVYKSNGISFKKIAELTKDVFTDSELNIYLASGMGDEARFSQTQGIFIVYAGE